jgi:hypothetical protein
MRAVRRGIRVALLSYDREIRICAVARASVRQRNLREVPRRYGRSSRSLFLAVPSGAPGQSPTPAIGETERHSGGYQLAHH